MGTGADSTLSVTAVAMRHYEVEGTVAATDREVFAYLDDHDNVSYHMNRPSWKMGGGSMQTRLDEGHGQQVGSHIRMSGRVLGIELSLDEAVTTRVPPSLKAWETKGAPKLVVIGSYRMGFEIQPQGNESNLRVFIDYSLPERPAGRWMGRLFGRYYAKWCTTQMLAGTQRHFESLEKGNVP